MWRVKASSLFIFEVGVCVIERMGEQEREMGKQTDKETEIEGDNDIERQREGEAERDTKRERQGRDFLECMTSFLQLFKDLQKYLTSFPLKFIGHKILK